MLCVLCDCFGCSDAQEHSKEGVEEEGEGGEGSVVGSGPVEIDLDVDDSCLERTHPNLAKLEHAHDAQCKRKARERQTSWIGKIIRAEATRRNEQPR